MAVVIDMSSNGYFWMQWWFVKWIPPDSMYFRAVHEIYGFLLAEKQISQIQVYPMGCGTQETHCIWAPNNNNTIDSVHWKMSGIFHSHFWTRFCTHFTGYFGGGVQKKEVKKGKIVVTDVKLSTAACIWDIIINSIKSIAWITGSSTWICSLSFVVISVPNSYYMSIGICKAMHQQKVHTAVAASNWSIGYMWQCRLCIWQYIAQ